MIIFLYKFANKENFLQEMEAPRSAKRKWEQFQDEDRVGAPISYDIHMRE